MEHTNRLRLALRQKRQGNPSPRAARHCRIPVCAMALAALLSLSDTAASWAQASRSLEYQVKAAFLFRFAQFVDWPPDTFPGAETPLNFCVIGKDPFRGVLETTLAGKKVGTHAARVLHVDKILQAQGCHLLFVGEDFSVHLPELIASLHNSAIVTIGDADRFAEQGGMIGFFWEDEKIRFDINLEAAEKTKLRISARLLSLARTVIGGSKGAVNAVS